MRKVLLTSNKTRLAEGPVGIAILLFEATSNAASAPSGSGPRQSSRALLQLLRGDPSALARVLRRL